MGFEITTESFYNLGKIIESSTLYRKGDRDSVPKSVIDAIDNLAFYKDFTDISNLHFDKSGRYFEKPEESKKQIKKVIKDIIQGIPIKPVIIDLKGNVVDGQHRMCAFEALNIKNIPILRSFFNDVIFDNQTTRSKKLNIEQPESFFKDKDFIGIDPINIERNSKKEIKEKLRI